MDCGCDIDIDCCDAWWTESLLDSFWESEIIGAVTPARISSFKMVATILKIAAGKDPKIGCQEGSDGSKLLLQWQKYILANTKEICGS